TSSVWRCRWPVCSSASSSPLMDTTRRTTRKPPPSRPRYTVPRRLRRRWNREQARQSKHHPRCRTTALLRTRLPGGDHPRHRHRRGGLPALVMKHYRSKAELFNEVGPDDIPLAELDLPRSQLGRALVQKILTRREHGISEPLLVAVSHVRESPEPHRTREEVRKRLL